MYSFSKIGKRVLAISLVLLLISSASLTIFTYPQLDAQTGYSGYSNAQLAAALTESVDRFNNISSILDKAVVTDLANSTILDLESEANSLLPQGQTKSRLMHVLDTAESALVDAGNFVTDGDITGAGSMLNITSDITSAFIAGVQKERGKSISNSTADILIANATEITDILQLQGIEVNPLVLSGNYDLPLATANLAASKAEMEDIQAIIAEFRSRGFVVELDAQHNSPLVVAVTVITIVDVVINAPGLAATTTHAVNEALIAEGEPPLTIEEQIALAGLNGAIYGGISESTALAGSTAAKALFIKAGLRTTDIVDVPPEELVGAFVSNHAAKEIYLALEPGLIESEKNLIMELRNIFGNNIAGFVYEDTNGTGVKDPFEEGIAAWDVTLRDSLGSVIETYVTSGTGLYDFKGLVDGNYTVTETVKSGWVNSTITTLAFELEEGNRHPTNNFGNYRPAQISGMKFNDANGDGDKAGESGLPNWTIRLKNASSGAILVNATTNANGFYSFANLRPGNYIVEEVQQSGYTQTSPLAPNTYSVTITSGANVTSLDFGNEEDVVLPGATWQYREHRYYASEIVDYVFTKESSGTQRLDIHSQGAQSAGYGYVFIVLNKADIQGKDIKITWEHTRQGPGVSGNSVYVLDGSYDRTSSSDFPDGAGIAVKGAGLIGSLNGSPVEGWSEKTDTLSAASINYAASTQNQITILIRSEDGHYSTNYTLKVRSLEILDYAKWTFENPTITAENSGSMGDYGTVTASSVT